MNVRISTSSIKSSLFLIIQFLCIFILGYTGILLPKNYILLSVLILSFLLAIWSMIIMKFHFNGAPEVLPGVTLKTSGPYKLIRHPMYTSLLGLGAAWIINDFSVFRFVIFIILLIDLLFKMYYEEKFLSERFPEYPEYKKHTKNIIPFIF
jgi:protein-S-isoprenylcysteine O-methyltransferase Ste14